MQDAEIEKLAKDHICLGKGHHTYAHVPVANRFGVVLGEVTRCIICGFRLETKRYYSSGKERRP